MIQEGGGGGRKRKREREKWDKEEMYGPSLLPVTVMIMLFG